MRDGINKFEMDQLVEDLKAGKTWAEAAKRLPDVDPKVLIEGGFKAWAHKQAGVELEDVDQGEPEKKKGKK